MTPSDFLTNLARYWAKVDTSGECWLWTGETNNHGYGRFTLWHGNRRTRIFTHRLALSLTGVALAPHDVVMHTCDTPACVRVDHLRVGTQLDNVRDALAKGRLNTDGLKLGAQARWNKAGAA